MGHQVLLFAVITAVAVFVAKWTISSAQWRRTYKLPPRVPGVPIFGNALQIPAVQQGPWAKALAEKHGEMYVISREASAPRRPALHILRLGS